MCRPRPDCGTVGGYAIHVKEKTPKCTECKAARASYMRRWKKTRPGKRSVFTEPVGVTRRLQALARDGYTAEAISRETGLPPVHVTALWRGEVGKVFVSTHRTVADLYERWAGTDGGSVITAKRAAKAGFAPWQAWDEDTIDDPSARPNLTGFEEWKVRALMDGQRVEAKPRDRNEAVRRLTVEWRLSADEIARLLHAEREDVYVWRRTA